MEAQEHVKQWGELEGELGRMAVVWGPGEMGGNTRDETAEVCGWGPASGGL